MSQRFDMLYICNDWYGLAVCLIAQQIFSPRRQRAGRVERYMMRLNRSIEDKAFLEITSPDQEQC